MTNRAQVENKELLKIVDLNAIEIQGEHPAERLLDFFRQLGWDGKKLLEPRNIVMHPDTLAKVQTREAQQFEAKETVSILLMWMNYGPSTETDESVEKDKIYLYKGVF